MHLAKHMQFHGVDYLVVPRELWDEAKEKLSEFVSDGNYVREDVMEIRNNMQAYDNSNEPAEIPNE